MKDIQIASDLLLVSFFLSLLFLIGIIRYFFEEKMYARLTIYSVAYFLFTYIGYLLVSYYFAEVVSMIRGSEVLVLNLMTIFLAFGLLATHGILSRLTDTSAIILLIAISSFLFPTFYFATQSGFFLELKVVDQGKISYLFLASGTMVWFFEIFLKGPSKQAEPVLSFDGSFLYCLGLPITLSVALGPFATEGIFLVVSKYLLSFCSMVLGIFSVKRDANLNRGFVLLALLASTCFVSLTVDESKFLHFPLCFVLGLFLPLASKWLEDRKWTSDGIVLLLSLLVVCSIALYGTLLMIPTEKWPHPPLVLLGVQSLYLLTIFLTSSFIASLVYFLPKNSEL
jgi:hypothetical protein